MREISRVFLWDRNAGSPIDAELIDGVTREEIEEAQIIWQPALKRSTKRQEHAHWDWNKKYKYTVQVAPLAFRMFGIAVNAEMQGLMLVWTTGKICKIESQKGKPLIYVDYLATAPWNSADVVDEPRYSGIGKILIRTAIQLSQEESFKGRIGLHSLLRAESWYRERCGMTDLGADASYLNLKYFEMLPEQAEVFLKEGE